MAKTKREPLRMLKPRIPLIATRGDRLPTVDPGSWRSGKRTSSKRGYGYAWQQRRAAQLRAQPFCAYCARNGHLAIPATVADHITPHRGDPALFDGPLQSLCASCHSKAKQREESSG